MPKSMSDITLSVIIPAYLEANTLSSTLYALWEYFNSRPYKTEIIVVDDGSQDRTSEVAREAGVKVIRLDRNRGKGAAVRTGVMAAQGDYILFTDADYPYEIDAVELCLEKLKNGADVAIGSRNLEGSNRGRERVKRKVISKIGNIITRLLILPGISDTQAGFKSFRSKAGHEIFARTLIDGWGFDIEALYIAKMLKYKIVEVPIRLIVRPIKESRIQSPSVTALYVLGNIFTVHMNRITGKYNNE
jgi:dolichyl-phosphate beta-glucosyltransferase